jgi:hypothetical protein
MLDPIKYPQYYVERPDQLSEKFKDQYEFEEGDDIFVIALIGVVTICVMIAFMGF